MNGEVQMGGPARTLNKEHDVSTKKKKKGLKVKTKVRSGGVVWT